MEASRAQPAGAQPVRGAGLAERPLASGMRWMLYIASALVFVAGFQLFVLTEATDRYFAWTIASPLTAAFLGAAYWSSCALEFLAARQTSWSRARIAVPAVLLFTALTLLVTLLHLDKFHLQADLPMYTQLATWAWIGIYASVPVLMSIFLVLQRRVPGDDAPRRAPLPRWLRATLALQAVVMLGLGLIFLIAPTQDIRGIWPWPLTELTARAVAAWLLGLGFAAAHAAWENDWERVSIAPATYLVFSVLQVIALGRYPAEMEWDQPSGWLYLAFLGSMLIVGVYGVLFVRRFKTTG